MRYQRRAPVTVQLVQRDRQEDRQGNIADATAPVETVVPGALFEPQGAVERQGEAAVPVIIPAAWNVPGLFVLDSDDQVQVLDLTDPLNPVVTETWEVLGVSAQYLNRTRIPVELLRRDVAAV